MSHLAPSMLLFLIGVISISLIIVGDSEEQQLLQLLNLQLQHATVTASAVKLNMDRAEIVIGSRSHAHHHQSKGGNWNRDSRLRKQKQEKQRQKQNKQDKQKKKVLLNQCKLFLQQAASKSKIYKSFYGYLNSLSQQLMLLVELNESTRQQYIDVLKSRLESCNNSKHSENYNYLPLKIKKFSTTKLRKIELSKKKNNTITNSRNDMVLLKAKMKYKKSLSEVEHLNREFSKVRVGELERVRTQLQTTSMEEALISSISKKIANSEHEIETAEKKLQNALVNLASKLTQSIKKVKSQINDASVLLSDRVDYLKYFNDNCTFTFSSEANSHTRREFLQKVVKAAHRYGFFDFFQDFICHYQKQNSSEVQAFTKLTQQLDKATSILKSISISFAKLNYDQDLDLDYIQQICRLQNQTQMKFQITDLKLANLEFDLPAFLFKLEWYIEEKLETAVEVVNGVVNEVYGADEEMEMENEKDYLNMHQQLYTRLKLDQFLQLGATLEVGDAQDTNSQKDKNSNSKGSSLNTNVNLLFHVQRVGKQSEKQQTSECGPQAKNQSYSSQIPVSKISLTSSTKPITQVLQNILSMTDKNQKNGKLDKKKNEHQDYQKSKLFCKTKTKSQQKKENQQKQYYVSEKLLNKLRKYFKLADDDSVAMRKYYGFDEQERSQYENLIKFCKNQAAEVQLLEQVYGTDTEGEGDSKDKLKELFEDLQKFQATKWDNRKYKEALQIKLYQQSCEAKPKPRQCEAKNKNKVPYLIMDTQHYTEVLDQMQIFYSEGCIKLKDTTRIREVGGYFFKKNSNTKSTQKQKQDQITHDEAELSFTTVLRDGIEYIEKALSEVLDQHLGTAISIPSIPNQNNEEAPVSVYNCVKELISLHNRTRSLLTLNLDNHIRNTSRIENYHIDEHAADQIDQWLDLAEQIELYSWPGRYYLSEVYDRAVFQPLVKDLQMEKLLELRFRQQSKNQCKSQCIESNITGIAEAVRAKIDTDVFQIMNSKNKNRGSFSQTQTISSSKSQSKTDKSKQQQSEFTFTSGIHPQFAIKMQKLFQNRVNTQSSQALDTSRLQINDSNQLFKGNNFKKVVNLYYDLNQWYYYQYYQLDSQPEFLSQETRIPILLKQVERLRLRIVRLCLCFDIERVSHMEDLKDIFDKGDQLQEKLKLELQDEESKYEAKSKKRVKVKDKLQLEYKNRAQWRDLILQRRLKYAKLKSLD